MAIKPWYTSTDIINSVKRKISFPINQNTFTENDILAFANEEMYISQVPSVLQFHEEYFVHYEIVPLESNLSRYPIPDRATGMKLRDLFWMDSSGNLFEMTRIEAHDKAYFQANGGSNQAIYKFYIEGNDVVVTPGVGDAPSGSLVPIFYLRPNQLVKNDRAATISGFNQTIKINKSLISPLDTVTIDDVIFTAVSSSGGVITALTNYSTAYTKVTCVGHQLSTGQTVVITGTDSNPSIDGSYTVTVLDANNFLVTYEIATAGTTGAFTCANQFVIGATDALTASNLAASITAIGPMSAMANSNTITLTFSDIATEISTSRTTAFIIPSTTIGITFSSLPSSYTDAETNITDDLFINGAYIDFLQTKPGHRTYIYDVQIPSNGISASSIYLNQSDLLVPSGSSASTSSTSGSALEFVLADLKVGDYICLANECIIPQIPPDLHNGLAERTSARILAAMGDQQGLQTALAKIQEIDQKQGNLLDNRSEGTPQKVVNRHSPLRYGKLGSIRRI